MQLQITSSSSRVLSDALDIIANPEVAQRAPASLRRLAWLIVASDRGIRTRQRHRGPIRPEGAA